MSDPVKCTVHQHLSSRRAFVKTSTAAAAGVLGWLAGKPQIAAADDTPVTLTKELRDAMTPDQILAKWKAGNARFREGRMVQRDFLTKSRRRRAGSFPPACCSAVSTRALPAEILFNLGMGDVFNCAHRGQHRELRTSSAAWSSPPSSRARRWCW